MGGPRSRFCCRCLDTRLGKRFFFLILERFRLDGYNSPIHLIRIQSLTLIPLSERSELLLRAPSRHLPSPLDAHEFLQTAAIGVPGEITATSILVTYWDTNVSDEPVVLHDQQFIVKNQPNHLPIYVAVVILFVIGVNFLGARYFGEGETCVPICFDTILLTGLLS